MTQPRIVEGTLVCPKGARIAIVSARFNHFIVDRLDAAVSALEMVSLSKALDAAGL